MEKQEEIAATDALRDRIRRAYEAGLVEYQALSMLVSETNKSYIQQFVTRGSPQSMKSWMRDKLSSALDIAEKGKAETAKLYGSFDPDDAPEPDFDPTWTDDAAGLLDGSVSFHGSIPGSQPEFPARPGMGEGQILDARDARLVTNGIATGHPVVNEWLIPHAFIRHALDARPKGIIILPVVGHSMEPRLHANDRVMVDTSQNTWVGDAVYVIDDGDTVFQVKTLRKIPSSNPPRFEIVSEATPDKFFERGADEFRIVGRVVGRISKM